jgi:hypothetical protein
LTVLRYTVTISLSKSTDAAISLARVDDRSYAKISSNYTFRHSFTIFELGQSEPIAEIRNDTWFTDEKTVDAEIYLEAGEYVVHVSQVIDTRLGH